MVWTRKRAIITLAICTIIAVSSFTILQMNRTTEAALIDPHPGLVGWWRFDEGTGNVAGDSSGNGNDGTVFGATWVDGKYNKALSFDGSNDYVAVPHKSGLSVASGLYDGFTILAWVETSQISGSYRGIVSKSYGPYGEYAITINSGRIEVLFGGIGWRTLATPLVNDGARHLIGYYSNFTTGLGGIILDGVVQTTFAGVTRPDSNSLSVKIGSHSTYYSGMIDEVRIHYRELSAVEIREDFQKGPDFSSKILAKTPQGTTHFIVTLTWQGIGSVNAIIESPVETYTEDMVPVYQKTAYSTSGGTSDMLNMKRISVSVTALSSDEDWYITLNLDNVEDYAIAIECQK